MKAKKRDKNYSWTPFDMKPIITKAILVAAMLLTLVGCSWKRDRLGLMVNLWVGLHHYALDHAGWFPQNGTNSLEAIQKLFPIYSPAQELAGLSGDIEAVTRTLQRGESLNSNVSSWVYVQGLREDDGLDLAILWERRGGIAPNGRTDPTGGHAVMFISGEIKQISGEKWSAFLKNQEVLRQQAVDGRGKKGGKESGHPFVEGVKP